MRSKSEIYRDYLRLLREEGKLNYDDKKIEKKVVEEPEVIRKLLFDESDGELYKTEIVKGQRVFSERAFFIFCDIIVRYDLKTGDRIWNSFIKKQFLLVEHNKQSCYMAARGHGKTFFIAMFKGFKMFLIPYYDFCYCSNVPVQRKRFLKLFRSIIDHNEVLLEKKDSVGIANKKTPWGQIEVEYNDGTIEGTTVGTTPRGGHYNHAFVDDPLRDDKKYTYEFIVDYIQGVLKQTILRKKGRYTVVGCVVPDTKIIIKEGIKEIGDLIDYDKNKKDLITFKKEVYGKEGWDTTSKFYVNGKTKTKKIITECGYEIECSKIHPIWACRNDKKYVAEKDIKWIKSAELKKGDRIAIKIGTQIYGKKSTIDKDTAYFYGLFIAEGCVEIKGRTNRIIISNKDPYCVNFLKDKYSFISQDEVHHRKNSKEIISKMRKYGVSFERCYNKRIPKKIMLEPKEIQSAFLQGLYDGDGGSIISRNELRIALTSTSKKQLQDVQIMLLNYGIVSSLARAYHKGHYKKDGGWIRNSNSYHLTCSGYNGIKFMKEIGFRIGYKNKDVSNINYSNIKEKFGFVWKKIKIIEDSENYTVDFVIPKTHSFLTNGIVSHNTPQDDDDPFHTLMNDKLDSNNRPIGKLVVDKISFAGFFSEIFPGILNDEKEIVLVPEIWTYAELMIEKSRIGEMRFNREILCKCTTYRNALIGASLFRSCCDSSLRMIQKGEPGKKYVSFVDPATSDAATADYFAMSIWEDNPQGNKFICRHLVHKKGFPVTDPSGGDDDQCNLVFKAWGDFNNMLLIIEKNNAGIALIQGVQNLASKKGKTLEVIEHFTHVVATGKPTEKAGKANDVIDYIEQGLKSEVVVFPSDPEDIYTVDSLELIKAEHLNFGVKKGKSGEKYEALAGHDDILDSCWGAFKHRGDMVDTLPMAITLPGNQ